MSRVVVASFIRYPRVRIRGLFLKGIPLRIPACGAIGWFALQVTSAFFRGDEAVGWFAHLGGYPAGAILIPVMGHRDDRLPARVGAQEIGRLR